MMKKITIPNRYKIGFKYCLYYFEFILLLTVALIILSVLTGNAFGVGLFVLIPFSWPSHLINFGLAFLTGFITADTKINKRKILFILFPVLAVVLFCTFFGYPLYILKLILSGIFG
ncbi:MAG: hypothetical protein COU51_03775 [Parcubacteria group bacterium CG10_big_fil_rev_8_21_14_0_10_36_14]|nr:MAG: hypothetical protein COU51_03775 [Parcubacteria group bacterium CG10_big_fil_rev_8_21_14_0_10_36_14]